MTSSKHAHTAKLCVSSNKSAKSKNTKTSENTKKAQQNCVVTQPSDLDRIVSLRECDREKGNCVTDNIEH
jgi:hypothetical protein